MVCWMLKFRLVWPFKVYQYLSPYLFLFLILWRASSLIFYVICINPKCSTYFVVPLISIGLFIICNYLFIIRLLFVLSEATPTSPQSHPSAREESRAVCVCVCVFCLVRSRGLSLAISVSSRTSGLELWDRDRDVAGAISLGRSAGLCPAWTLQGRKVYSKLRVKETEAPATEW